MEVYALIGASGTGKSHRASLLAYQKGINYIIDDGLLIKRNTILAGISAKREKTRMGATKRAIFLDPEHASDVQKKIEEARPDKILVVGISKHMVRRISERLNILHPGEIIHIEDIATSHQIALARETREKENRHVVPLPTFAIEKHFPGFVINSIKSFFLKKDYSTFTPPKPMEQSIVRPLYSTLGNFFLSENVIEQIAVHAAQQQEGVAKARKTAVYSSNNGMILNIDITLNYRKQRNIPDLLKKVQETVKKDLENLTGSHISSVNVTARHLILHEEKSTVAEHK